MLWFLSFQDLFQIFTLKKMAHLGKYFCSNNKKRLPKLIFLSKGKNVKIQMIFKINSVVENSITLKNNLMAMKEGPIHLFVSAIARKNSKKTAFQFCM